MPVRVGTPSFITVGLTAGDSSRIEASRLRTFGVGTMALLVGKIVVTTRMPRRGVSARGIRSAAPHQAAEVAI